MTGDDSHHPQEPIDDLLSRGLDKQLGEVLVGLAVVIALSAMTVPFTSPHQMGRRWLILGAFATVATASWIALRRLGRRPAAAVLCGGFWLLASVGVALWGGVSSPLVWVYTPTIIATALFWAPAPAAVQALLGVAVTVCATLGMFDELVPRVLPATPAHGLSVMTSSLVVTSILVMHSGWTVRSLLRAARSNGKRLSNVVSLNPDAIVVVSTDGHVLQANASALDITGRRLEDTLGCRADLVLGPEIAGLLDAMGASARLGPCSALLPRSDDVEIPVELYASSLDERELLVSIRDIRERRRAHQKKLELERRLRATARLEAIGRIAGGVAHDLNNLLTVVMGATHLLGRATDEPTRHHQLDSIRQATDRAVTLVRQLLASGGKQKLDLKSESLSAIVSGLELILVQMITDDVDLRLELDDDEDARVQVDRGQFEQVVMNLVKNASDAMPSGGKLVVRCSSRHLDEPLEGTAGTMGAGDVCVLEVSDDGIGMDEGTIERIFEPFFTSKASSGGTGLGLATVFGIVKQHGGTVTVASTPGEGSTFTVVLPRDVSSRSSIAPVSRRTPLPMVAKGRTALLVEDDALVRRATERTLRGAGFEVLSAPSAEDALQRVADRDEPVALVITDCVMPKMDGLELARQLAAGTACPPILFVSGSSRPPFELPERASFLAKPYDPDRLLECVSELVTAASKPSTQSSSLDE
ncbi:MAG TPA: response regulator [Polyangiaceae bacterium]|nr:response regulator [Polyangiaceae bacterium]